MKFSIVLYLCNQTFCQILHAVKHLEKPVKDLVKGTSNHQKWADTYVYPHFAHFAVVSVSYRELNPKPTV